MLKKLHSLMEMVKKLHLPKNKKVSKKIFQNIKIDNEKSLKHQKIHQDIRIKKITSEKNVT